ncbi:hypothetical protein SSX86_016950 [Deinandra increscens subsp. villosa]|uniref:F-box domain-containing protein n=1 Tax=Deinandra increscens subsp. villosa TaxID=3103831 RepID=A0AAP0CYZ3_9ASTR
MTRSRLPKMDNGNAVGGSFVPDDFFGSIPEGFVAQALSLTSPRDACRLSLVCSVFRSAADWDAVWESFLPRDYQKMVVTEAAAAGCCSKKQLYLRLCDHPVIIDGGNKSFSLDKQSGKKCLMLGARDLSIVWGDTPRYWRWISLPESRFTEVAELISVCWFEVHGRISTSMLSPNTLYVAFIVFKSTSETHGFEYQPAEVSVGISGLKSETQTVFLEPQDEPRRRYPVVPRRRIGMYNRGHVRYPNPIVVPRSPSSNGNGPKQREDGWMEIELGEYFVKEGEEGELEMSMREASFTGVVHHRRLSTTVLSFGDGSLGALGLPTSVTGIASDAYEPTTISTLPPDVSTIAAGHYHSLAVTSGGHLWSWGRNVKHQLGRSVDSPREARVEPQRVNGLSGVRSASASGVVSAAIGGDGSLWIWEKSKRGQLGLGNGITEAIVPSRVKVFDKEEIIKVV